LRELVTNVVLIFLYSQGKMRGAGDSFGDELEERARKRLELEEVRQKRVAVELQLGARRKDAEAAQRRLAELSSGTLARAASAEEQSEQSDGEEAVLDAAQDPAQRHMLINERIAQRRLQREKQSQMVAKKGFELQREQEELQKLKASVAAETAKEQAEAVEAAREVEAALDIKPLPAPVEPGAAQQSGRLDAGGGGEAEQHAGLELRRDSLQLQVLAPEDVALTVAKAVPRQESSIDMYNNDVGKRFMKQTGALKAGTLYFAS
jgi:hypothetical protein